MAPPGGVARPLKKEETAGGAACPADAELSGGGSVSLLVPMLPRLREERAQEVKGASKGQVDGGHLQWVG